MSSSNTPRQRIFAILTFVPLVGFFLNLVLVLIDAAFANDPDAWFAIGTFQVVLLLDIIALMPIYLSRVFRNNELTGGARLLWSLAVVLVSIFAMPKYYMRYLRDQDA